MRILLFAALLLSFNCAYAINLSWSTEEDGTYQDLDTSSPEGLVYFKADSMHPSIRVYSVEFLWNGSSEGGDRRVPYILSKDVSAGSHTLKVRLWYYKEDGRVGLHPTETLTVEFEAGGIVEPPPPPPDPDPDPDPDPTPTGTFVTYKNTQNGICELYDPTEQYTQYSMRVTQGAYARINNAVTGTYRIYTGDQMNTISCVAKCFEVEQ